MDLSQLWGYIKADFTSDLSTHAIVSVLLMTGILSVYMFLIYRYVSKKSFYSKQFNMAIAIVPFFISTIIMTLQSNLIITLGTIGALAIIRFRTAIKDPMDMVYLLWAVHTGITCGAGQYELSILTSIAVTVLMLILDLLPLRKAPYLLIVNLNTKDGYEEEMLKTIKQYARFPRVKSRNLMGDRADMIIELRTNRESALLEALSGLSYVEKLSLVSHDGETII